MHECLSCQGVRQIERGFAKREAFVEKDAFPNYAPDRPFKMHAIALDLEVDPEQQRIEGEVTHELERIGDATTLVFDQVGLDIQSVKVGGSDAEFWTTDEALHVVLSAAAQKIKRGERLTCTVRYRVTEPKRGLYFTGLNTPQIQVWSQGQDEDNRHWIPTFDYPNQKATVSMKIRVPKGYHAISNGRLTAQSDAGKQTEFVYEMRQPIVTYLITLVVGVFERWEDKGPRGLPVEYFVAKGRKADGVRSFKNTPKMIEAFEAKIGEPYPYEKYAQTAVQDFIFGGMENASATTQTDWTLHDERAALDVSSDPLVAHELAHQWFGDLLTCRDWSHGWLNEGFATFFERVWAENHDGDGGGPDEAAYISLQDWKDYLAEDSGQYRRPIVCSTFEAPQDLFDRHLYQKGGLVLNALRGILGEDAFWRSIQLYVQTHRHQHVETLDLIRAIEASTGKNMRRFFDQWVFGAGHPDWKLRAEPKVEGARTRIEITFEQKQTQGKAPWIEEHGFRTWVFQTPVEFEVVSGNGKVSWHRFEVTGLQHQWHIEVEGGVKTLRFDPENVIPKECQFERPRAWVLAQLKHAKDALGRIDAARALGTMGIAQDRDAISALADQAARDPFWGTVVEIAEVLAALQSTLAQSALLKLLPQIKSAKARAGVIQALSAFRGTEVFEAVLKHARKDASYAVEATATRVLARTLPPSDLKTLLPRWEALVTENLQKDSYLDQIRRAALSAWVQPPAGVHPDRPGVLKPIEDALRGGVQLRLGAVTALGKLAQSAGPRLREEVMAHLRALLADTNFFVRRVWMNAVADARCREAVGLLEEAMASERDARILRSAKFARARLHASLEKSDAWVAVEELRKKVERIEKRVDERKVPQTPPKGSVKAKRRKKRG